MATQHGDLTEDDWRRYDLDRQILTIAAEMNRARNRLAAGDLAEVRRGYERILNLTDLTVAVQEARGLRRELLRWREVIAALYVAERPDAREHDLALSVLLTFSRAAFAQRPYLLPSP